MNFCIKFLFLIIYFDIKSFVSVFVSIGDYPDYKDLGVNHPLCGFNTIPTEYIVDYPDNCFSNQYKSKIVLVFDKFQNSVTQSVSQRIFQGEDTPFAESPWTVLIRTDIGDTCTGVLITFQWVLTAAHCSKRGSVDQRPGHPFRPVLSHPLVVGIGSDRYHLIEVKNVDLDHFYRHHEYTDPPDNEDDDPEETKQTRFSHDIALIKLNTPFTKHKLDGNRYVINTICLPKIGEINTEYDYATYYGYGLVEGKTRLSNYLQKARVILNPFGNCSLAPRMFCAHYDSPQDARPCSGDSGGPLVQQIHSKRTVLIGIMRGTTKNTTCSIEKTYAYWVAVPNFIDWILHTIRENS